LTGVLSDIDLPWGLAVPIETKFANVEGAISGYGARFGNEDLVGHIIAPGAFAKTLRDLKASGRKLPLLWQHAMDRPIGAWHTLREDEKGLWVEGQLELATQLGREAQALVKAGALDGLSIGYRTAKGSVKNGVRILEAIDLYEVSLVTLPANPLARVQRVKQAGGELFASVRELEDFLHGSGLPRGAAKAIASGGFSGLSVHASNTSKHLSQLAGAAALAVAQLKGAQHDERE